MLLDDFEATLGFIKQSANHIAAICKDKGIALSPPTPEQKAA